MKKSVAPVIGLFVVLFAIIGFLAYKLGEMAETVNTLGQKLQEKENSEEAQKQALAKEKEKEELDNKNIKDIAAVLNDVTKERTTTSSNS